LDAVIRIFREMEFFPTENIAVQTALYNVAAITACHSSYECRWWLAPSLRSAFGVKRI